MNTKSKVLALEPFFEHGLTGEESENLTQVVGTRVTPFEKERLQKLSLTQYGKIDVSTFIRDHLRKHLFKL